MGEPSYSETVPATRLASLLLAGSAVGSLLLAAVMVAGGETLAAIVAGVVGVALFAAYRTFSRLRIEVGEAELVASFGAFRQRIELATVSRVAVERYDWLPHGGWGIRFGLRRRRAYSVPFRFTGVRVEVPGARWYFSSEHPDELAAALERAREERSQAG